MNKRLTVEAEKSNCFCQGLALCLNQRFLFGFAVSSPRSSSTSPQMAGVTNRKRGMVLPFEQHSITFDEIKYSVDMPQVRDSS